MPLKKSNYRTNLIFRNSHFSTMYPTLFRKAPQPEFRSERIELDDSDFLDLFWLNEKQERLIILSHGMEGSAQQKYIRGMAALFAENGFSVLAWNQRSCGGVMNRLPRFYHSCSTDDLARVIKYAEKQKYKSISIVAVSLGANQLLHYLGTQGKKVSKKIKSAVAISATLHLPSVAKKLARRSNFIYMKRFVRKLGKKVKIKSELFPGVISHDNYNQIKNFTLFDRRYTAPLHGFENEEHYWSFCSSLQHLHNIQVPTLLLNARNDPFLTPECFPEDIARESKYLYLEAPRHGGHVGFYKRGTFYYSEERALEFVESFLTNKS